ncbi:MAG TPA: SpoIIE family protein phosphatase, partial [Actinomycetota bacterium]|nr:SpoIIE family protein phosphatase [Actinomycetota bacterium]
VEDTFQVRLSLRWKIVGGFGVLLLLIALLGWVTFSLFSSLRGVQRKVFDDAIPGLVAVDEIVRSYTAQSAAVRGFLIGSQQSLLDQYEGEKANADIWEGRAATLFTESDERSLLSQVITAGNDFQELIDHHVGPLAKKGQRAQAFRILGQDGTPLIGQIETLGGLLRQAQDNAVAESESDLRGRSNTTIVALVLLTIGALSVGTAMAVVLPRHLVADLSKLVDAARGIERGNFDQKIEITSRDEVGELAKRFGEMQLGLKRLQQLALQDRELEIAASIQRNLLQRTLPETPGARIYPMQRQANRVGGDWYNVEVSGRSLSVVVGDASGKGIGAALMATLALSALRAERARGATPKQVIELANRTLREATDSESFTTLIYATLDLGTGETRWMNMGHHPPFVIRGPREQPDGSVTPPRGYFLEGPRNRALGWFDDPGFVEVVVTLEPGDRMLLFTDGFLEAKAPDGEVFGQNRFAGAATGVASLPAEPLVDELVADVERFAAGKLDDDLTMLVVEWLGTPAQETLEQTGERRWPSRR